MSTVQREMGPGWGHITVLHFLTDLGLACKPDLHLVRTVRHLGIVPGPHGPRGAKPIRRDNDKPSCSISGREALRFFNPARLRYVDKTLMNIFMHGLIQIETCCHPSWAHEEVSNHSTHCKRKSEKVSSRFDL